MANQPLLDRSHFPIVTARADHLPEGYSTCWIVEMDAILARRLPFVLVYLGPHQEEAQGDRKVRTLWLKAHRETLAKLCRFIITVEPDADARARRQAQGEALGAAFGVTFRIASSDKEAIEIAQKLSL